MAICFSAVSVGFLNSLLCSRMLIFLPPLSENTHEKFFTATGLTFCMFIIIIRRKEENLQSALSQALSMNRRCGQFILNLVADFLLKGITSGHKVVFDFVCIK